MNNGDQLEVPDFENMLYAKYQIAYQTIEEIEEFCQEEMSYATFIDSVSLLMNYDEGFLYLDESFPLKIEMIIEKYRFIYKDSDYIPTINGIIGQLNLIKADSEMVRNTKLEHYLEWQENIREVSFVSEEDFIMTMADDVLVYHGIKSQEELDLPSMVVYSSLNYFTEMCPKVFEDGVFYQHTMDYLDTQQKRVFIRRKEKRCNLETKEHIQKVKKGF